MGGRSKRKRYIAKGLDLEARGSRQGHRGRKQQTTLERSHRRDDGKKWGHDGKGWAD